jgi:hypothetical protein
MARIISKRNISKIRTEHPEIDFTTQVWKEGATYVSYAPELDVSSCGDSVAQARARLREAVSLFLEYYLRNEK